MPDWIIIPLSRSDTLTFFPASINILEPSILHAFSLIKTSSAQDLALLTASLIAKFPDIYSLYKEKQFTYNDIKQLNRNKLLWRDDSSDGVKTGHTESAGYCLVGAAKRGDMRLITVIAGSNSDNNRFLASQRLLAYGFRFYDSLKVLNANQGYKEINIWGGKEKTLDLGVLKMFP